MPIAIPVVPSPRLFQCPFQLPPFQFRPLQFPPFQLPPFQHGLPHVPIPGAPHHGKKHMKKSEDTPVDALCSHSSACPHGDWFQATSGTPEFTTIERLRVCKLNGRRYYAREEVGGRRVT